MKRPARPGEVCTCGRQAELVFEDHRFGLIGSCGERGLTFDHKPIRPCPFCEASRHAESGVCPAYRIAPEWAASRVQPTEQVGTWAA